MRRTWGVVAGVVALAVAASAVAANAVAAAAKRPPKPKERYFIQVTEVEVAEGVTPPAGLPEKARAVLLDLMAKRPGEFVTSLAGAPDPDADPRAFEKWLERNKIKAFKVVLRVRSWSRTTAPIDGKNDVLLTVRVDVSLLGASMPLTTLAMTGDGSATVAAEVSSKIPPRVEASITDDALRQALTRALDQAVHELRTAKPTKPKR